MKEVVSEVPRRVRWLIVGGPLAMMATFVYVEVSAILEHGFEPSSVAGWAFLSLCLAFVLIPFLIVPSRIVAHDLGLELFHFTGRKRQLSWQEIEHVNVVGSEGPKHTRGFRIEMAKGSVPVPSQLTNYQELLSFVLGKRGQASPRID